MFGRRYKQGTNLLDNVVNYIRSPQAAQMFGAMSQGVPFGAAHANSQMFAHNLDEQERQRKIEEQLFGMKMDDRGLNNEYKRAQIDNLNAPAPSPVTWKPHLDDNGNIIGQINSLGKLELFPQNKLGDRKYDKAADGFNRYLDNGEKVFPGVEKTVKPENNKSFDNEKDLRAEFRATSKTFEETQRNYFNMQQNAADKTGASDVALVFSFFKTIDPQSTVREGEFATAASASGLPQQFVAAFERLDSGEFLPDSLRNQLVEVAGRAYEQRSIDQQALERRYRELSESYKLNPDNVVYSLIRKLEAGEKPNESEDPLGLFQ